MAVGQTLALLKISEAGLLAMGRVNSDGSTDVQGGSFSVTNPSAGVWHLAIPNQSPCTGTLLISPEGGDNFNVDNIVSYEWDAANTLWVIQSRDLTGTGLQAGGSTIEDMFSFAFFAGGEPASIAEQFLEDGSDSFDLEGASITYTPKGPCYDWSLESITELPVSPSTGTTLTLDDDASVEQSFSNSIGAFRFYDAFYPCVFVGSNGYVTFGSPGTSFNENLSVHFSLPRIAPFFDDLSPNQGGSVRWGNAPNFAAITWDSVPQFNEDDSNTFQLQLFADGRVPRIASAHYNQITFL